MTAPSLGQMVRELCEPSTQATRLEGGDVIHQVNAPSLLDQLSSREPTSGAGVRRGFGSRPAASIEAIDTAKRINDEAREWASRLGISTTGKPGAVVLRLYGHSPQMDAEVRAEFTDTVRRWWTAARVTTGWDQAAAQPRGARCPVCDEKNTLRVRIDELLATCVECGSGWDRGSIGLLGEHVRRSNGEVDTPSEAVA